ncbi:hypothetical protein evm_014391 [Chilo suppressalis]|nr:hypothetical protein evm_014391 [Chilo suppressalis]
MFKSKAADSPGGSVANAKVIPLKILRHLECQDDGEEHRGRELDEDEENDFLQDSSADDSSENDDDSDTIDDE